MANLLGERKSYTVVGTNGCIISKPSDGPQRGVIILDADGNDVCCVGEVRDVDGDELVQYAFVDALGLYELDPDKKNRDTVLLVKKEDR